MKDDVFRKEYKPLTVHQTVIINRIKQKAEEILECLPKKSPRHMALARTKLEEAVMWAVKGITE